MIVIDTNVLSEALKPTPAEPVLSWLAAQDATAVFTTAITQAEVLYGVEILPAGRRRSTYHIGHQRLIFANRVKSTSGNSYCVVAVSNIGQIHRV